MRPLVAMAINYGDDDIAWTTSWTYLNFGTTNPSNSGQVILHEQMVGFIVETPLTDDHVGTGVLDTLDHLLELVLLIRLELLVLLDGGDVQLVLGLWLGRLEWASQNGNLGIGDLLWHLRMGKILSDEDTLHQLGVGEGATHLSFNLDQFKINVLAFQISDGQHGIHGNASVLFVVL